MSKLVSKSLNNKKNKHIHKFRSRGIQATENPFHEDIIKRNHLNYVKEKLTYTKVLISSQ